jgi:hypothetical protein
MWTDKSDNEVQEQIDKLERQLADVLSLGNWGAVLEKVIQRITGVGQVPPENARGYVNTPEYVLAHVLYDLATKRHQEEVKRLEEQLGRWHRRRANILDPQDPGTK